VTAEFAEYYTSVEDYLAGERVSQQKHEYLAGVIYAMAGTTVQHDLIAGNFYRSLGNQLARGRCYVFSSDVKVRIENDGAEFYYYPDVTVDCGSPAGSSLFAEQPVAIFEVMSPDTERIDRGEKLRNYQSIPSLNLYALVDQFHTAITVYRRAGDTWTTEFLTKKEDAVVLPDVDCTLSLADIYERTHLVR
jgi:Uma2 family endonuclease